ncbi:hypothetical protein MKR03_06745 [Klebsiella sp. K5-210]|uniref:hypothetical protein n=1 Tax=Klebsiella sp. K5-210 TaxID=2920194 RepID=UPI0024DE6A3F|nr:hypothetical protein [Klebsiella sp. K5-210]MDK1885855.1 hypothetical protein [Klebsiella sp. K5-210]
MTDITELAQREKFEAWAEEAGALPWGILKKHRNQDGSYPGPHYTYMWKAWQAASAELVEALEKAQQRIAELESSGVAPGILRCTECSFVQTKNIISLTVDTITTVESESEPCPNGCGQLQPITWKALAIQLMFTTKQGLSDLLEAKNRIAELEREQEQLRQVGVMSEQAFHRLENRECRFIALWPRPGIFLPRKRPEDGVIVYARTVAAVGSKVEVE